MTDIRLQKTNVTLKMLVDSDILSAGTSLTCRNPEAIGKLNDDGSITVWYCSQKKKFDYLSGAARFIEKKSINGWLYWEVIVNGERQNLGDFRDLYLETLVPHKPE